MATNHNAIVAALCIFNGLKLSPVNMPLPGTKLCGPALSPHFTQTCNYLNRFFSETSTPKDFAPLELFDGTMAVAPWIRGAVGILQYTLHSGEGIDVPDADMIDPAAWFDGLPVFAGNVTGVLGEDDSPLPDIATLVRDAWEEPGFTPQHKDSRQFYLSQLYGQARILQARDAFLVNVQAIARARTNRKLPEGKTLPLTA